MPPLGLLSASPIVATPQLFETTSEAPSSLLEWISPLSLLSAPPILASLKNFESTFEASSRAASREVIHSPSQPPCL